MSIGRRLQRSGPFTDKIIIGNDWPFDLCECGKWKDKETGEHAVSMSLDEALKELEIEAGNKCPDVKKLS